MPRRYYYYDGFGAAIPDVPDTDVQVTMVKTPFYQGVNPVGAFLTSMQKTLGVPQTGEWDLTTHNAYWGWIMAREALTATGGVSDMPPVLPWKPQVCASDGFPLGLARVQAVAAKAKATVEASNAGTVNSPLAAMDCVDTAWLITESLETFIEDNQPFLSMLGWPSLDAMRADAAWNVAKNNFGVNLVRHLQAKLASTPVLPPGPPPLPPPVLTCPTGQVLDPASGLCVATPVVTTPPTVKPKAASVGWILGGLAVAGLLLWVVTRKTTPPTEG